MRAAYARLLVVIANIPQWIGMIYGLLMPVFAGWIAHDDFDGSLLIYTYIFLGGWALFWVFNFLVWLTVLIIQYVGLGSTSRAALMVESQLDNPELIESMEIEGTTKAQLVEQFDEQVKIARTAFSIAGFLFVGMYYVIGLAVVWFINL